MSRRPSHKGVPDSWLDDNGRLTKTNWSQEAKDFYKNNKTQMLALGRIGHSVEGAARVLGTLDVVKGKHAKTVYKSSAIFNSIRGVSERGKRYVKLREDVNRTVAELRAMGFKVINPIDYAEAAVEGRYEEAREHNRKLFHDLLDDLDDTIEQLKSEQSKVSAAEAHEIGELIDNYRKKRDVVAEWASEYARDTPKNAQNSTETAAMLRNLHKGRR